MAKSKKNKRFNERGWESVQLELKKTAILCQNCHTEIHEGLLDLTKFIKKD